MIVPITEIFQSWAVYIRKCPGRPLALSLRYGFNGYAWFLGFIAEFPIFMGAWKAQPIVAIIAIIGVIITAAYIF